MKTLVKCVGVLFAMTATAAALGQATIAELRGISGNVLVSTATGMASGTDKQRLSAGTVVTTTATGGATIAFDSSACVVTLKPNERLEVQPGMSCSALLAAVQLVPAAGAIGGGMAAAGGGSLLAAGSGPLLIGGAFVAAGGYAIYRNNRNSSPN